VKRRGVIVGLMALLARVRGSAQLTAPGGYILDLSPVPFFGQEIDWEATDRARRADPNMSFVVMKPPSPPTPQSFEVRLGSRVVRLTAEQIMDALEGKQ